MLILYLLLSALACLMIGVWIGVRLRPEVYNGHMVIEESDQGLVYRLEFVGDPELLVFEEAVHFKVVSPNYQELLRAKN